VVAAFDAFVETWGVKYDKAVERGSRRAARLLGLPGRALEASAHHEHHRKFVRHGCRRTVGSKGCLSNKTALPFKLTEAAERSCVKPLGYVIHGKQGGRMILVLRCPSRSNAPSMPALRSLLPPGATGQKGRWAVRPSPVSAVVLIDRPVERGRQRRRSQRRPPDFPHSPGKPFLGSSCGSQCVVGMLQELANCAQYAQL